MPPQKKKKSGGGKRRKKAKASLKHVKGVLDEATAMLEGLSAELATIDESGGTGATNSTMLRWAKGSCPPPIRG